MSVVLRSTMARLIDRVRLMINDPSGDRQVFTDQAIQDSLDMHRIERWWIPLRPLPTFQENRNIEYLTYVADSFWGAFEEGAKLQRADYSIFPSNQITEFNPWPGRWDVTADSGQVQGVRGITLRVTGRTYDLFWAAADLLRFWAAKVALDFDFQGAPGQRFSRSQQQAQLLALAEQYLRSAQPVETRLVSGDQTPDGAGGGVVYPAIVPGYYGGTGGFGW